MVLSQAIQAGVSGHFTFIMTLVEDVDAIIMHGILSTLQSPRSPLSILSRLKSGILGLLSPSLMSAEWSRCGSQCSSTGPLNPPAQAAHCSHPASPP